MRRVLGADVGGTKVAVGRADVSPEGAVRLVDTAHYSTAQHDGLEAILRAFLTARPDLEADAACLAVAGPVREGRATLPNVGWTVSAANAADLLGCPTTLVNDLQATTHGIDRLPDDALVTLQAGVVDHRGSRAVIAPGTGLGMASAAPLPGGGWLVSPSEGGHQSFAARTPREWQLRQYLAAHEGAHVDIEHVASGLGLARIFAFLSEAGLGAADPATLATIAQATDPNPAIVDAARAGCERAAMAVTMFVEALGAAAGDLALTTLSTGGLYVAGGIPPKILDFLRADGRFLAAIVAKGRFEGLLTEVPIHVIIEPATALLGAAALAATLPR